MRKLSAEDLKNKTIKTVDASCDNVVYLEFEDGTKLQNWAEVTGPFSIPCLLASNDEKEKELS